MLHCKCFDDGLTDTARATCHDDDAIAKTWVGSHCFDIQACAPPGPVVLINGLSWMKLVSRPPTAQIKDGSGGEGVFFREQPSYHGADFVNFEKSPTGNFRQHKVNMFLGDLIEDACLCGGGSNAVDGDTVKGGLLAKRLCKGDDSSLGGAVSGGSRVALLARDGGDVDDTTVVLAKHVRNDSATAKEDTGEVDVNYLLPCFEGIFPGFEVWAGDTSTGD